MKRIQKNGLLLLVLSLLVSNSLTAQKVLPKCATDEMMKNFIQTNPGFQRKTDEMNNRLYSLVSEKQKRDRKSVV